MWGFYRLGTAAQAEAMLLHDRGCPKTGRTKALDLLGWDSGKCGDCESFCGLGQRRRLKPATPWAYATSSEECGAVLPGGVAWL